MKNSLRMILLSGFLYLLFCGFYLPLPGEALRPQSHKNMPILLPPIQISASESEMVKARMEQPQPLELFLQSFIAADRFSRSA